MFIRIHAIPVPSSKEPDFVKAAYIGLVLEATELQEACKPYPSGWYSVPLGELVIKMGHHNPEACTWLTDQWGPIADDVAEYSRLISVCFGAECCTEVPSEAVN